MRHRLLPLLTLAAVSAPADALEGDDPVRVYVLCGQSNMVGHAKLSLLAHQATDPATRERFAHFGAPDAWRERDDVWIDFLGRRGPLTVGYGGRNKIGPELDFGHTIGDASDAPVVLIKCAWGGKSLFRDFRPPSAGLPGDAKLAELLEREQKRDPDATLDDVRQSFGHYYRETMRHVAAVRAQLGTLFPELEGRDHELSGFVWFQGWNDMIDVEATAEYAANMVHFVHDVRRELGEPELPFVIGQLGVGGEGEQDAKRETFKKAQARAAEAMGLERVALVRTDAFWDHEAQAVFDRGWKEHLEEWEKVGSDYPYHYLGSARTYSDIGRAFAEAVLTLQPIEPTRSDGG